MFRSLISNTLISALAYGAISILGLIVIQKLLSAYGLTVFGLISLAKLLSPTGTLGMIDLGVGETASLVVARARGTDDWQGASDQITWHFFIAISIGIICGLGIYCNANDLSEILKIPGEHFVVFTMLLRWIALSLPLLFVSLVAEGLIKGFENYSIVRLIEVLTSLFYSIGTLVFVWTDKAFILIAYLAVVANVLRALISIAVAGRYIHMKPFTLGRFSLSGLSASWHLTRHMALNKVLGTAQMQTAPTLVGILVGPAGVGAFDALTRLPRFAKTVFGLINSALLPFAARIEAEGQTADLKKLGSIGLPIVAAITMPSMLMAATFSKPILQYWLGHDFGAYWYWQSLMFLIPIMTTLISFGSMALFMRGDVPGRMNKLMIVQLGMQLFVSLMLVGYLQERAFILGQVSAMVVLFFWQLRLVFREQGLGMKTLKILGFEISIGLFLSATCFPIIPFISSIWQLSLACGAYLSVYALFLWLLLLDATTRSQILHYLFRREER